MQDYLDGKSDDFDGLAVKRFLLGQAREQVSWYRQSIDALDFVGCVACRRALESGTTLFRTLSAFKEKTMTVKTTESNEKRLKDEAKHRHDECGRRLKVARQRADDTYNKKYPERETKPKTEPRTASISNEEYKLEKEGQPSSLIGVFCKLIELSLAVIGIYVGETRKQYKELLRQSEKKTDAELEDEIDNTLSNFTSTNWLIFLVRNTFKAFRNMREFAGDMFTLATIALKRDRRILTFVLGICLLIGFGVMYLYDVFFEIVSVYTFIREIFGLH